jgi:hypothetical protein
MIADLNPLEIFEAMDREKLTAEEAEKRFRKLSRQLLKLQTGREWLIAAMVRYNFHGSVFSAENMDPALAAHRDGMRAVISDLLNSAAAAKTPEE